LRGGVGFAGMRMGRATDQGNEFPPPHGTPKAKDHDLIITPRIAARSGHLSPLRVRLGHLAMSAPVSGLPESGRSWAIYDRQIV